MEDAEQILAQLPYLKEFELKTVGTMDLANGHQWERLVKDFRRFNFRFWIHYLRIEDVFDTFRSHFWLEEKRWFIAYHERCLFSIPRFLPNSIDVSRHFRMRTTAPDHSFIYDHMKRIIVSEATIEFTHFFSNIDTLNRHYPIPLGILTSILDVKQIKHLTLLTMNHLIRFIPLESIAPELRALVIKEAVTLEMLERIRTYRFKQIHQLQLSFTGEDEDYMVEELFHLFPSVEAFLYSTPIKSEQIMYRCIDGFNCLTHANFWTNSLFSDGTSDLHHSTNLDTKYSKIVRKRNFTCRVRRSSKFGISYEIHWWIGEQVKHSPKNSSSLVLLFL